MRVSVTGATGLLGANLVQELLAQGHSVRCLHRQSSQRDHLKHLNCEWVLADLGDEDSLTNVLRDSDWVFHCAASTSIRRKLSEEHQRSNLDLTKAMIAACRQAKVKRLIHCSSVVAVGGSRDGSSVDEAIEWNFPEIGLVDGYSESKRLSEEFVKEACASGLNAVIVNPSFMFGPMDAKLSSGRMLVALVQGKIPGYTDGSSNFVDARDVAKGMILAAERGKKGERYILGGENLSYEEAFQRIGSVLGISTPTRSVPKAVARIVGWFGDMWQWVTGRDANLNSVTVAYSYSHGTRYSSEKAMRELGYRPGPIDQSIRDAVSWFRDSGVLPPDELHPR